MTLDTLDELNKKIVELLQADGRRSYASIGREVGLSEAATRQRVQRLLDTGVMQIVAVTNPLQLGFHRQAWVAVKVAGDIEAVADALAEIDEVDYVVIVAGGPFHVMAEVLCEDDHHLLTLINRKIHTITGVDTTEIYTYLELKKQLYNWGTR